MPSSNDMQFLTEAQVRRVLERLNSLAPDLVQMTISNVFEEDSVVTQRVSNTTSSSTHRPPLPPYAQGRDEEGALPEPVVASDNSVPPLLSARRPPSCGDLQPLLALHESKSKLDIQGACYLVEYDRQTGQLLMYYSLKRVERALGVFYPGPGRSIARYGKSPIVGVSDTQKNYCSGWCQFVLAAKALGGSVTALPPLTADLYLLSAQFETIQVIPEKNYEVSAYLAVACLPKDTPFVKEDIDLVEWMAKASLHGAANCLQSASYSENIGVC